MKTVKLARDGYLMMSLIFYISGVLYMVLPEISPMGVCISSGVILTVYGVIKIVGYFSSDLYCLAFQYDLACGLGLILLGVLVLAFNQRLLPYLAPGLGMLILVDNLLAVQMSYDAKKFGIQRWYAILTVSILTGCFAILQILRLWPDALASRLLVGLALLAEGLKNQCVVTYTVKLVEERREKSADWQEP